MLLPCCFSYTAGQQKVGFSCKQTAICANHSLHLHTSLAELHKDNMVLLAGTEQADEKWPQIENGVFKQVVPSGKAELVSLGPEDIAFAICSHRTQEAVLIGGRSARMVRLFHSHRA